MNSVFRYEALFQFAKEMLAEVGACDAIADALAGVFLEADLLGFSTHGLSRLSTNVRWIENGETRLDAEIEVLRETAVASVWDAHFLPGPWVVRQALEFAATRAAEAGISVVSIRKVQHIACLAAYLERITQRGLIPLIAASTPGERSVSAFGGVSRVFSPNPLALGVPTSSSPILIDTTMSMVAEGKVKQALVEGTDLPLQALKNADGDASSDPDDYWQEPAGSLLPVGGIDQGFKGTALLILIEVLTMALNGYGRLEGSGDGEANSVFVQVLDPEAFGGRRCFLAEVDDLVTTIRSSRVKPGDPDVRVPGDRALRMKADQLQRGVVLRKSVVDDLRKLAARYRHDMPQTLAPQRQQQSSRRSRHA